MFGKLLKYDFRSMLKQFAFIWPAALALAVVNHFTVNSFITSASQMRQTTAGIAMLVYMAILIAMFVIAVIFVIQRFYKGLLGDEGYLMHTLPVKPWQLIASRLLCACVTTFVSVIVAVLSILIIFPWDREDFAEIFQGLWYVFTHWNIRSVHIAAALLETCVMAMTSFAAGYLLLYLAMSIGHLFNKNRVAWSVVVAIALNTAMNTLIGIFMGNCFDALYNVIQEMNGTAMFHTTIWIIIAGELIMSAVYFAGTEFILRKKLNLE